MAKAFYFVVAAVLLCPTTLFSAASSTPHASSSSYKKCIVLVERPPHADIMDDDARNSWYESFLPSNLTDSGKPRMVTTFHMVYHGFAAWLTEAELDVMSKKPGFRRWFESENIDPGWSKEHTTGRIGLTQVGRSIQHDCIICSQRAGRRVL
ncbi:hypothetical protein CFC21_064322 [Triticum aestivum]|uniref:Inhibitor I9 domain-containing protein n=2 Tax=Triticum aestivum TaxID=4565 RepID=A0A9R1H0A7_WHEAT|nr:hypothetical protein CFC21_064322 [Triticum aestivum]